MVSLSPSPPARVGLALDWLPAWSPTWAPTWAVNLALISCAALAGMVVQHLLAVLLMRSFKSRDEFWRRLLNRTGGPARLAAALVGAVLASAIAPLDPGQAQFLRHAFLAAGIVVVGFITLAALDVGSALYIRRFRVDVPDNLVARKHLTQVRVLRQGGKIVAIVLTAGLALMTIPGVRQWGVSLLAAGGAAGVLVGLALQPLLSNLLAGIQLATTQPIRLGDKVQVENESGCIEEITATYVVVRVWDDRRLVLPLTYFLQTPFQNLTRQTAQLLGTVMLYVDYTTPVAPLRARLKAILEASEHWDGRVQGLQVTDARERTMELRCLVSAADSGKLFDLRCDVREQMIGFLQREHPDALPRNRVEVDQAD